MTDRYNADEYLDALVTLELATRIAQKDKQPINRTIRACWSAVLPRVANELNRRIFDGMAKQFMPHGALCILRRQLDESLGE